MSAQLVYAWWRRIVETICLQNGGRSKSPMSAFSLLQAFAPRRLTVWHRRDAFIKRPVTAWPGLSAFVPRAGLKVFTLQGTVPLDVERDQDLCADPQGNRAA